jgi:hypothetical protein
MSSSLYVDRHPLFNVSSLVRLSVPESSSIASASQKTDTDILVPCLYRVIYLLDGGNGFDYNSYFVCLIDRSPLSPNDRPRMYAWPSSIVRHEDSFDRTRLRRYMCARERLKGHSVALCPSWCRYCHPVGCECVYHRN